MLSLGLAAAGCTVSPAPPASSARLEETRMIDRCFDGGAAATLGEVSLEYAVSPTGSMRIHYQTAVSAEGERQLVFRSTASGSGFNTSQDLAFAVPGLGSRSARVQGGSRVALDLAIADGDAKGESMMRGGEMVAIDTPLDDSVLLPGAERALLPFLRVEQCDRLVLPSFYPPDTRHDVTIEIGRTVDAVVGAGRFEAIEVFVDGRNGRYCYLVRSASPHFVLKSVSPDGMSVMELTSIGPSDR
jgi:hypothetical protein